MANLFSNFNLADGSSKRQTTSELNGVTTGFGNYISQLPNVMFPFVRITFGPGGSPYSVTSNLVDGKPRFFVSLTHKRIVNRATEMSIQLSFAPSSTTDYSDPNILEQEIVSRMGLCLVEYGHNALSKLQRYWTMLTGYTISFSGGVLTYSLSGISQAVVFNDSIVNFKYPEITSVNPIPQYETPTKDGFLSALKKFVENNSKITGQDGKPTNAYTLDLSRCTKDFTFNEEVLQGLDQISESDFSMVGVLIAVVAKLVSTDKNNDSFFTVIVDDTYESDNEPKKIYIKKVNLSDDTNADASLAFRWNNPEDGVISFSADYNGNIAMYRIRALESGGQEQEDILNSYIKTDVLNGLGKASVITLSGLQSKTPLMLANISQAYHEQAKSARYWAEKANYPYGATLEVIGNPDNSLQVADLLYLDVLLGNSRHHTSGTYMIKSITDSISTQGFKTTYELMKYKMADYDPYKNIWVTPAESVTNKRESTLTNYIV